MKKFLDNFFELRKSPTCVSTAILGLLCFACFIFYIILIIMYGVVMHFVLITPVVIITSIYLLSITISPIIFLIEKIRKIKIDNNFVNNSKIYKIIWTTGFILAIIEYLFLMNEAIHTIWNRFY